MLYSSIELVTQSNLLSVLEGSRWLASASAPSAAYTDGSAHTVKELHVLLQHSEAVTWLRTILLWVKAVRRVVCPWRPCIHGNAHQRDAEVTINKGQHAACG
jgi:hypothetical protein